MAGDRVIGSGMYPGTNNSASSCNDRVEYLSDSNSDICYDICIDQQPGSSSNKIHYTGIFDKCTNGYCCNNNFDLIIVPF